MMKMSSKIKTMNKIRITKTNPNKHKTLTFKTYKATSTMSMLTIFSTIRTIKTSSATPITVVSQKISQPKTSTKKHCKFAITSAFLDSFLSNASTEEILIMLLLVIIYLQTNESTKYSCQIK